MPRTIHWHASLNLPSGEYSDIVPDSEPEREAQRQRLKEEKRKVKAQKRSAVDSQASNSSTAVNASQTSRPDQALFPDTQPSAFPSPSPAVSLAALAPVISTVARAASRSGTTDPISISTDSNADADSDPDSAPKLDLARFAYANHKSIARPARPPITHAYSIATSTSSDSRSPDPNNTGPSTSKSGQKPNPAGSLMTAFSGTALSRLLTCPACQVTWTARKTAPQKLTHIRSCAKKKRLTEETVIVLIGQELDKVAVDSEDLVNKGKGKGKGKGKDANLGAAPSKTWLEHVVEDFEPKKKYKRSTVSQTTVRDAVAVREVIEERARTVLGDFTGATSSTIKSTEDDPIQPFLPLPATQVFGPNKLAGGLAVGRKRSLFASGGFGDSETEDGDESNGEAIPPSSTQAFAPSKLGASSARPENTKKSLFHAEFSYSSSEDEVENGAVPDSGPAYRVKSPRRELGGANTNVGSVYSRCTLGKASNEQYFSLSSSSRDSDVIVISSSGHSPSPPPQTQAQTQSQTRTGTIDDVPLWSSRGRSQVRAAWTSEGEVWADGDGGSNDEWKDDGAILHFDPYQESSKTNNSKFSSKTRPRSQASKTRTSSAATKSKESPGSTSPARKQESSKKSKPRSRSSSSMTKKTSSATSRRISPRKSTSPSRKPRSSGHGEDFESRLRQAILDDNGLHHRILRYEPIHFDVFLKLASDIGIPQKGAGLKLRAFLDKEGINHYGIPATSKRRSRRRT